MKLLKKYIKALILESMDDVIESTDPLDWIDDAFQDYRSWRDEDGEKSADEYWAMFDAAKSFGLTYLGRGSARRVFAIDNDKVIKLAVDQKGIAQNKIEAFAGKDPFAHKILASVYQYDNVNFSWIIAERLNPLNNGEESRAEEIIGIPWIKIRSALGINSNDSNYMTISHNDVTQNKTNLKSNSNNSNFIENFKSFLKRYKGLLEGDLEKTSSWGIKKDGSLALLDYGITKETFKKLYK